MFFIELSKGVDPFLKEFVPLLETYINVIREITSNDLIIQQKILFQAEDRSHLVQIVKNLKFPTTFDPPLPENVRCCGLSGKHSETIMTETLSLLQLVFVYNEKLLEFLMRFLSAERNVKLQEKLSSVKLVELKEEVEKFSQMIDRTLHYYTVKSLGLSAQEPNLPTLEELKEQKEQWCSFKKHLQLNELHEVFVGAGNEFTTSDTVLVCALLGITREYGEWMDRMEPYFRLHQDELYYLVKKMEIVEQDLENIDCDGQAGLSASLMQLGFTRERAAAIVCNIPADLIDRQWPTYWAERYLEHAFLNHPLLNDVPRYPYSADITNNWFQISISSVEREEPYEDNTLTYMIDMINIDSNSKNTLLSDFLGKASEKNAESVLLYHGTTHAGAASILTNGIILSNGRPRQDFSSGDGFYVTENVATAEIWSRTARGQHQAIVVFKVNKDLLDADKEKGIDVTNNRIVWEEIVKLCRNGYTGNKAIRRIVKDFSFIRGPVCQNPKEVAQGQRAKDSGDVHICVRGEEYCVKFGSLSNILCVIFY